MSLYLSYKIAGITLTFFLAFFIFPSLFLVQLSIISSVTPVIDFIFVDSGLSSLTPPFSKTFALDNSPNFAAYNFAAECLRI